MSGYIPPDWPLWEFAPSSQSVGGQRWVPGWQGHPHRPVDEILLGWRHRDLMVIVSNSLNEEVNAKFRFSALYYLLTSGSHMLSSDRQQFDRLNVGAYLDALDTDDRRGDAATVTVEHESAEAVVFRFADAVISGYATVGLTAMGFAAVGLELPDLGFRRLIAENASAYQIDPLRA